MVDKKKAKAEATNEENNKEKNTEGNQKKKKKGNRHHKKVVIKSNHLSHSEVQALHQKMLEATNDGSTPPMQPAVSNAMQMQMPMQMPNVYGGSQMTQFPQQMPMNNFQPVTPETNQHAQSSQRDEHVDNNEYGFEGNENPETTIMHKIKKKAQKKHHHNHRNHHHKKEVGPINIYDLGKGILESFTVFYDCKPTLGYTVSQILPSFIDPCSLV